MLDRHKLEEQLCELPLYEYHFIDVSELTFTQRVREICRTECPMYGKSWACPPGTGSVEECRRRCQAYRNALLIATVTEVRDIADIQETLDTRADHEELTRQAAELVRQQTEDIYVLSSEACAECEECSYPAAPCRFPDRMNPCIESHGILLTDTLEALGIEFQFGGNVVTWFSLVFYNE